MPSFEGRNDVWGIRFALISELIKSCYSHVCQGQMYDSINTYMSNRKLNRRYMTHFISNVILAVCQKDSEV